MKPTAFKVAGYMGILLIIVAATLMVINPKTENNLPAGFRTPIIAFEFFRTAEQINHFFDVEDISAYKQAMLTGNAIDYLFMFLYSGLVFCIALGIKKITRAETDKTIKLFARSFGVAFNFRKFVKSISGSEILKITFESMPRVS